MAVEDVGTQPAVNLKQTQKTQSYRNHYYIILYIYIYIYIYNSQRDV